MSRVAEEALGSGAIDTEIGAAVAVDIAHHRNVGREAEALLDFGGATVMRRVAEERGARADAWVRGAVAVDVGQHGRRAGGAEDDLLLRLAAVVCEVAKELVAATQAGIGPAVAVEVAEQRLIAVCDPAAELDRRAEDCVAQKLAKERAPSIDAGIVGMRHAEESGMDLLRSRCRAARGRFPGHQEQSAVGERNRRIPLRALGRRVDIELSHGIAEYVVDHRKDRAVRIEVSVVAFPGEGQAADPVGRDGGACRDVAAQQLVRSDRRQIAAWPRRSVREKDLPEDVEVLGGRVVDCPGRRALPARADRDPGVVRRRMGPHSGCLRASAMPARSKRRRKVRAAVPVFCHATTMRPWPTATLGRGSAPPDVSTTASVPRAPFAKSVRSRRSCCAGPPITRDQTTATSPSALAATATWGAASPASVVSQSAGLEAGSRAPLGA